MLHSAREVDGGVLGHIIPKAWRKSEVTILTVDILSCA